MQDYRVNNMRLKELQDEAGTGDRFDSTINDMIHPHQTSAGVTPGASGNIPAATSAVQSSSFDASGTPTARPSLDPVQGHNLQLLWHSGPQGRIAAEKRLSDILTKQSEMSNRPTLASLTDVDTDKLRQRGVSLSGKTQEDIEYNIKPPDLGNPHYTDWIDPSGVKHERAVMPSGASDTTDLGATAPSSQFDAVSRAHPGADPIALLGRIAGAQATPAIKESTEGGLYRVNPFGGAAMPIPVGGGSPASASQAPSQPGPDGRYDFSDVRTGTEAAAAPAGPKSVTFGGSGGRSGRLTPEEADQLGMMAARPSSPMALTTLKDIGSRGGVARAQVILAARKYDPNFSEATLERNVKMLDAYQNGKEGQGLQSFGTFLVHAGEAADMNAEYTRTGSPLLNKPISWIRNNSGDPQVQRFIASLAPVGTEWMTFLQNNHALQADDRHVADSLLNPNQTLGQTIAVLNQMGQTAVARYGQMNSRFKKNIGVDIPDPFDDAAKAGAAKIGLNLGGAPPTSEGGQVTGNGGQPVHMKDGTSWQKVNGQWQQVK